MAMASWVATSSVMRICSGVNTSAGAPKLSAPSSSPPARIGTTM